MPSKAENNKVKNPPKKKLTLRETRFVEELANPKTKSKTEAARKAGYSKKNARHIAYKKTTKDHISVAYQNRIQRALKHHQVTPEEVLGSAVFQMRSSMDDLMDEEGFFDLKKARETGAVDLIKEIEFDEVTDIKTGKKTVTHKVKFDSSSAARKEVANYIGLEKFQTPAPEMTDEQLVIELFNRLQKKGFKEKQIVSKLEKEFPAIDVKAITK